MSLYLLTLLRHKYTSPKEESLVTSLRSTSSKDVWKPSSPFARPSASAPKSFKSGRMSSWYEVLRRRLQKIREQKEPIRKLWIGFNSYFTSCYGTLFPLTNERYQPIKLPCLTSPLASPCPIHSDTPGQKLNPASFCSFMCLSLSTWRGRPSARNLQCQ